VAHIIEADAFKNWSLGLRDNGVFYTGLGLKLPGKINKVVPSGNMLIYYLKASAAYEDVTV
jgi:hypothetical protein